MLCVDPSYAPVQRTASRRSASASSRTRRWFQSQGRNYLLDRPTQVGADCRAMISGGDTTSLINLRVNGDSRTLDSTTARRCSTPCASTSISPGPRRGATTASAAPAPFCISGRRANSCLALRRRGSGRDIVSIEGLAHERPLHPLQQAFIDHDALQCGYCTPGQICSAAGMLAEVEAGWPSAVTADLGRDRSTLMPARCGSE